MSALMHHPSEDTLLAYAAGTLDEPSSVLVATHLSLCPKCRALAKTAEAVGGELMEALAPVADVKVSVGDLLQLIDAKTELRSDIRVEGAANSNQADTLLPQPLRTYVPGGVDSLKWRWMGPGVRYARILDDGQGARVGLMRIASGTRMPHHGHADEEFTMVLAGGYTDAFGSYRRGDVETADTGTLHQPVADDDGDCMCLVVTRGALKPTGLFAKLLQPLMPL
ncbi:MAG: cupin domain-containing protein [Rhodospirillaceae bacterium]|nr:cupin domain-containing protein [Rhodospirillaceae bacterium]